MKFKSYLLFFLLFGLVPDVFIAIWWNAAVCLPTVIALFYGINHILALALGGATCLFFSTLILYVTTHLKLHETTLQFKDLPKAMDMVTGQTKVNLTLSGHTHGLKYKLAGPHPSSWKFHHSKGTCTEGDQTLHVTAGR